MLDTFLYGAQGIALAAYEALQMLYPERPVKGFLVTSLEGQPSVLAGLPVMGPSAYSEGLAQYLCFYNYNLILVKKEVLREYCAWLFPILAYVEENSSPKGRERSGRYLGYMAENLETLYFLKNRGKPAISPREKSGFCFKMASTAISVPFKVTSKVTLGMSL